MHFIVPLLITGLCSFPMWAEASASKHPPSKQQTVKVDNKKLTSKQQREIKKAVKQKKCVKALDKKTKKVYYVCEK